MIIDRDMVLKALNDLKDFRVEFNKETLEFKLIYYDLDKKGNKIAYCGTHNNIHILIIKAAFEKIKKSKDRIAYKEVKEICHSCNGSGEISVINDFKISNDYFVQSPVSYPGSYTTTTGENYYYLYENFSQQGKDNESRQICPLCDGKGFTETLIPLNKPKKQKMTGMFNNLASGILNFKFKIPSPAPFVCIPADKPEANFNKNSFTTKIDANLKQNE